ASPAVLQDRPDGVVELKLETEGSVVASDRGIIAALRLLTSAWPRSVPYRELEAASRSAAPKGRGEKSALGRGLGPFLLGVTVFDAAACHLIGLHTHVPEVAARVSERPAATRLVRYQATSGRREVTNVYHRSVCLHGGLETLLLPELDGTHDRI